MKSLLLAGRTAVRSFFVRLFGAFRSKISGAFRARPALRRGLLVFFLFCVPALPLVLVAGSFSLLLWACVLAAVFLGLGAERASTNWDDVFALPAARHFKFWRWQALERRRYQAVLCALGVGQALVLLIPVLWGII